MKGILKIDVSNERIVMDRAFSKRAYIVGSTNYELLQRAKTDYPGYAEVIRTIRKNPDKESYRGLTYDYMEHYILFHENSDAIMKEYREMRLIALCHSSRYPEIKKWFLAKYPEIAEFGMPEAKGEPNSTPIHVA